MTSQSTDPRIDELVELAAEEGRPLALRPDTIIQHEDAGAPMDPFTGSVALPVGRWLTARGRAVAMAASTCALLLALASLAPLPVAAQTARPPRRPSPVPVCRLVHGVRVCAPVTGGSGITPPIFAQQPGGSR